MKKKIVLAGGSGFMGQVLAQHFQIQGYQVIVLSRKPAADNEYGTSELWDSKTLAGWKRQLEGADVLINLAGRSVDCRYNEQNKAEIINSRVDSTRVLGEAIHACQQPPKLWIQASSATIYRHAEDRQMDEETGELGEGFSVDVCRQWEATFHAAYTPKTRKVLLRTALVLGRSGGVLPKLLMLARLGLGGQQGNGKQMVSWIHESDVCRAMDWFISHPELSDTFNLSAPEPMHNREVMRLLRAETDTSFGLPSPKPILELGAIFLQTETELVLKSRWVIPKRLHESGFEFSFPILSAALRELLSENQIVV